MRVPFVRITKFDDNNIKELNEWMFRVAAALSQNVEFGDGTAGGSENIFCDFATVTFGVAGTELTASHDLARVPIGAILIKSNMAGDIYMATAATSASIFLTCDTNNLSGVVVIF